MSSVANTTSAIPSNFLPPPGTNWLEVIKIAVPVLMMGSTFGAVEVVMLFALLFFSTSSLRRSPLFLLNLAAICFGIGTSGLNTYTAIHSLESPTSPTGFGVAMTYGCLVALGPTLIDCILLIRIFVIYHPRSTPRYRFLLIMGIPIVLNIGRFSNNIIYLVNYGRSISQQTGGTSALASGAFIVTSKLPNVKIEWFLQIFNNSYLSLLFLWPVYQRGYISQTSGSSVARKVAALFWLSISSFVPPVLLSIVQLVVYMVAPERWGLVIYILEANFHITIISVVFATLWAYEGRWAEERGFSSGTSTPETLPPMHFQPGKPKKGATQTVSFAFSSSEQQTAMSLAAPWYSKTEEAGSTTWDDGMPQTVTRTSSVLA